MKILVTGGCGYVGSKLVPYLYNKGHEITVLDALWFGNYLEHRPNLNIIRGDIRDLSGLENESFDIIIHLANIANDPAVDLNATLSWEVNVLASYRLAEFALKCGCKQFLYASSGSVYGVKDEPKVTENLDLVPISTYNKTKMIAERVLMSYASSLKIHCIRPATVCGWSPRMRLDVAVNILTFQALTKNEITVFGGDQTRPNIHINDMIRVYDHFITNPQLPSGFYNAGFENLSIAEIADMISKKIGSKIVVKPSNDPRSYNQCSDKLVNTGFIPEHSVNEAIDDLISKYKNGNLVDSQDWHTVKKMKILNVS